MSSIVSVKTRFKVIENLGADGFVAECEKYVNDGWEMVECSALAYHDTDSPVWTALFSKEEIKLDEEAYNRAKNGGES